MPKRPPSIFDNPQLIELPAELHPLVAAWMEWERRAEEEARKENRKTWPKNEDTYIGRRRIRIRDALFKAAEAKGHGLEHPEGQPFPVSFQIKGRLVEWSLEEQPGHTFRLIATIGQRKSRISEKPHKSFDRRADVLLDRLEKFVDATIADEIRCAEIDRQIEAEIRAEERPRRLKAMESARWDCLGELAKDWQKARLLRSFIDEVERSLGPNARAGRATAWLEWARARVHRLDPLSDGRIDARRIVGWRYEPDPDEYEVY
ncbi:MAG: hypothetical protein WDM91_08650 [Rhizomicrobium sp.]